IAMEFGGAARLADRVAEMGFRSVMIVTDRGVVKAGLLKKTLAGFANMREVKVALYADVQADPAERVINAAVRAARAQEADCIIGFGGGSSLDAAKLTALL